MLSTSGALHILSMRRRMAQAIEIAQASAARLRAGSGRRNQALGLAPFV
jgi:predicted metal-dependent hydrolase